MEYNRRVKSKEIYEDERFGCIVVKRGILNV